MTIDEVLSELGNPDVDALDEETVQRIIDDEDSFYGAVARCARILSNYFALKADKSIGDVSVDYQSRAENWQEKSEQYEAKAGTLGALPFVGGADYDKPDFYRGQFERDDCDGLQRRVR